MIGDRKDVENGKRACEGVGRTLSINSRVARAVPLPSRSPTGQAAPTGPPIGRSPPTLGRFRSREGKSNHYNTPPLRRPRALYYNTYFIYYYYTFKAVRRII